MCVHILEVYMKRSHRVGAICQILTESPERVFNLKYFCDRFSAAKSSISEDISAAKEAVEATGYGYIETIPGAAGGVKYVPDISPEQAAEVGEHLCDLLREDGRILGGGFLYTSDIMYDPAIVKDMARIFAKKFRESGANYVATIETKGIPVAFMTAQLLNLPVVVVRRETKISEGATVSIELFSRLVGKTSENVYFQKSCSPPVPRRSSSMTSCAAAAGRASSKYCSEVDIEVGWGSG